MAGSQGNMQTVDYVVNDDEGATGWSVKKQPFEFPYFQELAPPKFARTAPIPHTFVERHRLPDDAVLRLGRRHGAR